jgi:HrpA-like helicases
MPRQTCPEILRTPLEELVLQVCLFEEQKSCKGVSPLLFLGNAPEAPHDNHIHEACIHLQEIGALRKIQNDPLPLFRLTPLGYHLSHLPMDAKVGKILVVGCILRCIEPSLTIAAILTATKSVWLPYLPGKQNSGKEAREIHEKIISNGFGGTSWNGGTVRGDLIAAVAAYNSWTSSAISSKNNPEKQRRQYALDHALDHNALNEIMALREQFRDYLRVAGLSKSANLDNMNGNDAILVSCCLVAGLYPNIATLLRPSRERRIKGGRLITKNGDSCKPSPSSFQADRVRCVSEGGKDIYAVYQGKHVILGANSVGRIKQDPFLSDVNFVSRFAIVLFGGEVEVRKNSLIVDNWLKFKIQDSVDSENQLADKDLINAIMLNELKKELDQLLVDDLVTDRVQLSRRGTAEERERVIKVVRILLNAS